MLKKLKPQLKLSLYSNKMIVVENYNELIDINEDLIKIDIYDIYGEFLKITKMDQDSIKIEGKINKIYLN